MTHDFARAFLPLAIGMAFFSAAQTAQANELLVFISAFTKGDEGAIHAYQLKTDTGELKLVQRTPGIEHPFFMALSPDRKYLYSIQAPGTFGGKENEFVAAYEITDATGKLKFLNRQSAMGTAACYLEVDATGKTIMVSNYSSGSVAALPIKGDGSLGEPATFIQHKPAAGADAKVVSHAHCIVMSPDNRFALAADLGLDQVISYQLDPATAKLTPSTPPFVKTHLGNGPRHLTFHPNGKYVYVINELKNSVTMFNYNKPDGTLTEIQTISTIPEDFVGKTYCADVKITPNGKFLYGTNRGHDSIAVYRIDDDGKLHLQGIQSSLGKGPQNLVITPNGELLLCANMPGNNVAVFKIHQQSGGLTKLGEPISIPSPSCIRIR